MGINLGQTSMTAVYFGQTAVKSVFIGSMQVWSNEPPAPADDWLCFTAQQQNSTVQLDKVGTSIPTVSLEYSFDKNTWTDYSWSGNTGDTLTLANVGDKVYMRAKTQNNAFARNQNARHNFVMTGLIAASGNIQTLLKADGSRTDVPAYAFPCLFQTCTSLTQAPTLPATTLADYCYYNMFAGCNALTAAPQLPATALATSCYSGMFYNTRLTSAPALPATTLAYGCYYSMFQNCTSLTTAPALLATTLANSCYREMFRSCTSLTTAPSLPATTLTERCYYGMFYGCTSLTTVPTTLPATTLTTQCYTDMFSHCTALTTAPAISATTLAASCCQSMFAYDTALTSNIELLATTLVSSCYGGMFYNCSQVNNIKVGFSEWTADTTLNWVTGVSTTGTFTCPAELPDTRGASNIPTGWQVVNPVVAEPLCFTAEQTNGKVQLNKLGSPAAISLETSTDGSTWADYSWNGTTGDTITLANIGDKVYFRAKNENQTFSASQYNCYKFSSATSRKCTVSGNIQSLLKADCSRTDAPAYCFVSLFDQCSFISDSSGLQLPATTLADNCYRCMFMNCTNLAAAPAVLPATTATKPYYQMFYGCNSLTSAPEIMATTLGSYACGQMFYNCTSLATVPKLHATSLTSNAMWGMFENCSSLSSVEVEFTDWQGATSDWLKNVAVSGTFTCPAELPDTRGGSNIPTGWTKVDAA